MLTVPHDPKATLHTTKTEERLHQRPSWSYLALQKPAYGSPTANIFHVGLIDALTIFIAWLASFILPIDWTWKALLKTWAAS